MTQKFLVGLGLLMASGLACADAAEPHTPKDVVSEIYRFYAGPKRDYQSCNSKSEKDCNFGGQQVQRFLTSGLKAMYAEMSKREEQTNTVLLEADPVLDNQYGSVLRLAIDADPEAGDTDIVRVAFSDAERRKHDLRYVMKREDGAWRIDNIRSFQPKSGWDDLRKDIAPRK